MGVRRKCDNCGEWIDLHCNRHVIPCCPHYPLHEQAAEAADREAAGVSSGINRPSAAADPAALLVALKSHTGFDEHDPKTGRVVGFHIDRPEDFLPAAKALAARLAGLDEYARSHGDKG